MSNLRALHINGCRALTGLAAIAGLQRLTCLGLHHFHATPDAFAHLTASLTMLRSLSLRRARGFSYVGAGMQNVGLMTALRVLSLDEAGDADCENAAGVRAMAAVLCGQTQLQELLLWGNPQHERIGDNSDYLSVADWGDLQSMSQLTRLTTSSAVSDSELMSIALLPKLHTLEIRGGHHITDASMRALERMPSLVNLDLLECPNITDAGMQRFAARVPLLTFRLKGSCITDKSIKAIAAWPHLRNLSIARSSEMHDAGLAALARCSSLKILDIAGCRSVTDAGLGTLTALRELRQLNLEGCSSVSNDSVESFKKSLLAAGPADTGKPCLPCVVVFY